MRGVPAADFKGWIEENMRRMEGQGASREGREAGQSQRTVAAAALAILELNKCANLGA